MNKAYKILIFSLLSIFCYAQELTSISGKASYYGKKFHGKYTASGEIFDMNAMTAAHRTLPLHTIVRVTNTINNKTVTVKINDRGPVYKGFAIDLSKGAASKLDMIRNGVVPVIIEIVKFNKKKVNTQLNRLRNHYLKVNSSILATKEPSKLNYYVQLGAFSKLTNAQSLAKRLQHQLVQKIIIKKTNSNRNTLFHVVIAGISKNEVVKLASKLRLEGNNVIIKQL